MLEVMVDQFFRYFFKCFSTASSLFLSLFCHAAYKLYCMQWKLCFASFYKFCKGAVVSDPIFLLFFCWFYIYMSKRYQTGI